MDRRNIYLDKLTPSAKEALHETMVELQDLLLNKANLIAHQGQTADKEISLRDIIEAKEALFKAKIEKEKEDYKRKRILNLISLTGGIYSIVGIVFYIYQNQNIASEKSIGLIIALAGILIIIFGFLYTQLQSRRYEERQLDNNFELKSSDNDIELIRQWQIIERLGSNLMRQKGYSNNASRSINDILKFLSKELNDDSLYLDLRVLLTLRNKVLHEGIELGRNEKQMFIDKGNKIIERLETLEK